MGKTLFSLAHLCIVVFVSVTVEFFFNKYYCDSVKDAVCGWGDEESGGQLRQEVLAQVHRKNGP